MFFLISDDTLPRTTTSDTAKRPPGLSTRNASLSTRSLSPERLMTQFEMMTSTELSGSGMLSISPFRNSTLVRPLLRLFSSASDSISSVISSPYAFPVGPTRRAESSTSTPPPEPRSRTVSPALSLASAVGFPQPSEASIASAGISLTCAASYRFDVIGSHPQLVEAAVAPQQELPPVVARSAASPYFSFTASLMFASAMRPSLLADLNYVARGNGFISRATLGIEKLQNFLQRLAIGAVAKEGAIAADDDQAFVP